MTDKKPNARATNDEIDLKAILEKFYANRKIIMISVAVAAVLGLLIAFTGTPMYKAQATVLLEPDTNSQIVSDDSSQVTSFIMRKEYMETQKEILHSRNLAKAVIEKLSLDKHPLFNPDKEASNTELIEKITTILQEGVISVSFVKDTRLVRITGVSPEPRLAKGIVNSLVEAYKEFMIEKKFATTRDTVTYLEAQTQAVKEKLAAKEQQLQRFGAEKEIFYVNKEDNTLLSQYSEINSAYSLAQVEMIKAESAYNRLKSMDYDDFPVVVNNPIIQRLKEQYSGLESEYTKKKETFKADYPEVRDLKAQLENLDRRIRIEARNIARKHLNELQNTFQSNKEKLARLKEEMASYQDQISAANTEVITYNTIKIEVENLKNLLNYMTNKLNETVVSARLSGLTTSNIKVVDAAELPRLPFKPRKKLILLMALFLGGAVGVLAVFALDFFRDSVASAEELQKITGAAILAGIPDMRSRRQRSGKYGHKYGYGGNVAGNGTEEVSAPELLIHHQPDHIVSEHYRTLRTSLLFSRGDQPPACISVTSPLAREGKTTTITNLALSFAKLNEQVLLIDGDMRKPRLHKVFEVKNHNGLSEVLVGKIPAKEAIRKSGIPNVWFMNSGTIPPNPSELLNARIFAQLLLDLRAKFDKVLIDSPPVVPVVDPLIIANLVDGFILTVSRDVSSRKDLELCMEKLKNAGVSLLGVVDNRVESGGFGAYSRYKRYAYKSRKVG